MCDAAGWIEGATCKACGYADKTTDVDEVLEPDMEEGSFSTMNNEISTSQPKNESTGLFLKLILVFLVALIGVFVYKGAIYYLDTKKASDAAKEISQNYESLAEDIKPNEASQSELVAHNSNSADTDIVEDSKSVSTPQTFAENESQIENKTANNETDEDIMKSQDFADGACYGSQLIRKSDRGEINDFIIRAISTFQNRSEAIFKKVEDNCMKTKINDCTVLSTPERHFMFGVMYANDVFKTYGRSDPIKFESVGAGYCSMDVIAGPNRR